MSGYGAVIFPQHAAILEASAITPEVARERGYVSADTKTQLGRYGFEPYQQRVPGLILPLHRADGSVWGYQLRADTPRVTKAGTVVKYETPKGQRNGIDVPPGVRETIGDPAVPLLGTEGTRKADSAVSAGIACVALPGVWGWRGTNGHGGKLAVADWHDIALNGRRVVLAFDSDVTAKPAVRRALDELAAYLATRDAKVEYLHLPDDGDGKTGLDDYLAAHGAGGLWELVRPEPPPVNDTPATPPETGAHPHTPPVTSQNGVCAPDRVCAHTPLIADAEDLLTDAVTMADKLGVTGETRIIKGTYLTAVSQVLPEPVNLVVKGASSGGKSYATRATLRLFPDEDFYKVTAMSQRSLIYTDEEFAHRTIVMYQATALREVNEQRDGDMTAMLVRTLLSEGQIRYEVSEKGPDGKMATRAIEKKGPTSLIVTTTADSLHHENETRLLSLTVDESEEQTRAVMQKIAARRNRPVPAEPPDLSQWHALFHWLKHHGEHRVNIPYADHLAATAAASAIRMRRDFSTLLGMIEAHAVLHQATRKRDQYGRIIATADDYDAARDILAEAFAVSSGKQVREAVRAAVAAVEALGGKAADVTVAQVARYLKRDRTRATRALKQAADLGYLTNQENKPGRAARYRTGPDPLPEDAPALPDNVPADEGCARTPPQGAHPSSQVNEGCAGVRGVQGGTGQRCTVCGEPLNPALAASGDTTHPMCDPGGTP